MRTLTSNEIEAVNGGVRAIRAPKIEGFEQRPTPTRLPIEEAPYAPIGEEPEKALRW